MAVNQAQVDHIISSASADDPEVKLLKLQDEVDLIKTSIKRLLIDIRERMNELENPFMVGAAQGAAGASGRVHPPEPAPARAHEDVAKADAGAGDAAPLPKPATAGIAAERTRTVDEHLLESLRAQLAMPPRPAEEEGKGGQKLRLQKVHRLFEWTGKTVKKYGHDRMEMMLDSYRAMGYITKEERDQVREIARLMPASLGDLHEIGPDEFVQELYSLNRILDPGDTSLDRDMIEVLMERRRASGASVRSSTKEGAGEEDWIQMQDR